MRKLHAGLTLALLFATCKTGLSQTDPTAGPERFPQFRNLSALAGSGYGVDMNGNPSLSGPTALSTPVAHVLGHNHVHLAGGKMSFSSSPELSNAKSNGTAFATVGTTLSRFNLAASIMFLSDIADNAINLQAQYIPSSGSKIVGSIGVQDVDGGGGSAGEGFPSDDGRSSTSVFGVATYRIDTHRGPIYLSGGWGTRRFKNGFASVSHQIAGPVRFYTEFDGFDFNEGLLFSWKSGQAVHSPILYAGVALIRSQYLTLSAGLGF